MGSPLPVFDPLQAEVAEAEFREPTVDLGARRVDRRHRVGLPVEPGVVVILGKSSSTSTGGRRERARGAPPQGPPFGSAQWWKALIESASVAQSSRTGSRSAEPRRTRTAGKDPSDRTAAVRQQGHAGSTARTRTPGALPAASTADSPGPQPMSTTRSPSRTPARSTTIRFQGPR